MLPQFVQVIFSKAIDESFFSLIYAKLCRKLVDAKDPDPAGGKDKDGKPAMIGRIKDFRKILLVRCQEEFESATLADSTSNSSYKAQEAEKARLAEAGQQQLSPEEAAKQREQEREESYNRGRIKRHMLGNIVFIGELFKQDILPVKIMQLCIEHLMPDAAADEVLLHAYTHVLRYSRRALAVAPLVAFLVPCRSVGRVCHSFLGGF